MPATSVRPAAGFIFPLLLLAMFALALAWLAGWNLATAQRVDAARAARHRARLDAAQPVLRAWYLQHLDILDTPGASVPDVQAALPADGAAPGIKVALSDPQSGPEAPGRVIVAWIPDPLRAPRAVFDPVHATLVDGGEVLARTEVDGRALEREAVRRAERQLRGLAAALERWFAMRVADDPLHRRDRNYFQPLDSSCLATANELPCLPDYTPAGHFAFWQQVLDLAPAALLSPWGAAAPVEASAGTDASQSPPFSLALRIRTPWGQWVQSRAVEPGT